MEGKFMTKRDIKSQRTKDNILKAAVKLLSKYGADALTVKNICDEAGVANGTFYHFFHSKDDIYGYFLRRNHTQYIEANEEKLNALPFKEKVKDLYLMHVKLCEELGLSFTSAYYSTTNSGLDAIHREKEPGSYYIMDKCEIYLREAQEQGYVHQETDSFQFKLTLGSIAVGVMTHWCMNKGGFDPEKQILTLTDSYLESLVTNKYRELFPE